jgi:hypothetical protein
MGSNWWDLFVDPLLSLRKRSASAMSVTSSGLDELTDITSSHGNSSEVSGSENEDEVCGISHY